MASPLVGTVPKWLAGKSGRSVAGRIQVCSHLLAGYRYALIGWQDTSIPPWLAGYKYAPIGW
jgi:hypothetical protein